LVFSFANKLVEPAKILIIVGMAYTLATTGWYIVSGPSSAPVAAKKSVASGARGPTIEEVIGFQMFGKADAAATTPAVFDAPETRLKLTLEGVFQAEVPEDSAAIVAEPGKPGELYIVGATLPGNVVLAEVTPRKRFRDVAFQRGAAAPDGERCDVRSRCSGRTAGRVLRRARSGRRHGAC
jgi:general secretion pathway protein C